MCVDGREGRQDGEAREQEAAANLAIEEEFEAALADAAKGPGPSLAELIAEYKNASVERRSAFVRSRRKVYIEFAEFNVRPGPSSALIDSIRRDCGH